MYSAPSGVGPRSVVGILELVAGPNSRTVLLVHLSPKLVDKADPEKLGRQERTKGGIAVVQES